MGERGTVGVLRFGRRKQMAAHQSLFPHPSKLQRPNPIQRLAWCMGHMKTGAESVGYLLSMLPSANCLYVTWEMAGVLFSAASLLRQIQTASCCTGPPHLSPHALPAHTLTHSHGLHQGHAVSPGVQPVALQLCVLVAEVLGASFSSPPPAHAGDIHFLPSVKKQRCKH